MTSTTLLVIEKRPGIKEVSGGGAGAAKPPADVGVGRAGPAEAAPDGCAVCVRFGGLLDVPPGEGVKLRFAAGAGPDDGAVDGAGDRGLPLPSTVGKGPREALAGSLAVSVVGTGRV